MYVYSQKCPCKEIVETEHAPIEETTQGTKKKGSLKTGSLLTHVKYSEKWALGGLIGWSLNTGGLKGQV